MLNSDTGDIISGMIFDLDGTIYSGNIPIPHAVDFVAELQEHGIGVMFYTNRAHRTPEQIAEKLTEMNFQVTANQILTSALVTAHALQGERVFCIGENSLTQALKSAEITITENNPDYVVVGYVEDLKGIELTKAVQYITHGEALFVATNQDPYIIVDGKRVPENGAIVAAVQAATGIKPIVYGKPNPAGIQLAREILQLPLEEIFIVGDTPATDIQCGINAGIRTALILSGVTSAQQALCSKAEWVVKDYKDLRSRVFGSETLSPKC